MKCAADAGVGVSEHAQAVDFPRVLLVVMSRIHELDAHGVSIRNWFGDWPRDSLAQIYSGGERNSRPLCGHTFKIGASERRWGAVFESIKRFVQAPKGTDGRSSGASTHATVAVAGDRPADVLVRQGVWELLFRPKLSSNLRRWIEGFAPDVVYAQGYSLAFSWLPLQIARAYSLPLCFHTGDDWPATLYSDSRVQPLMSAVVRAVASELVAEATVRLANGPQMSAEYTRRYGVSFEPLMMCDSFERFETSGVRRLTPVDVATFIYSGNLGHGRWQSLADLCSVLRRMEAAGGMRSQVLAFVSRIPEEAASTLHEQKNLQLLPPADHVELPSILRGGDVLFLPETFDSREVAAVGLSVSTKAHLYMLSKRPILVYGHRDAGVVRYAREGWGLVVDERDPRQLGRAATMLTQDAALRERLLNRATQIAQQNHSAERVRPRLRSLLAAAASTEKESRNGAAHIV